MNQPEYLAPRSMPWWIMVLYGLLALAFLAFVTLLVGDLLALIESGGEHSEGDEGLHHLPVFDLAWPAFLVAGAASLLAGIGALLAWLSRRPPFLGPYAALCSGFVAIAVAVLFGLGKLEL